MDKAFNIKGHFTIESFNAEGKQIDKFADKNLVVLGSRAAVAALCSGIKGAQPINRLSLGTRGHISSVDKFTPKEPGGEYAEDGKLLTFDENRTQLFTEDFDEYTFDIKFYPVAGSDESQKVSGLTFYGGTEIESQNTFVEIFADMNSVTYTFTIEEGIGHGSGFEAYTEAGLYAGDVMFTTKTFSAKVKDESTKFVITWKIYF